MLHDTSRHTGNGHARGQITGNNGIRADSDMITDGHAIQDLRPGPNIHMPAKNDWPCKGDLVEKHAIGADLRVGMDDDPSRMRQAQTTCDPAVQMYLALRDRGPEQMVQHPVSS